MDKRTGHEVREERDEEEVVPETVSGLVAAIDVHQEGNLEEGEKRDGQRHHEDGDLRRPTRRGMGPDREDPEVFVIHQKQDIGRHAEGDQDSPPACEIGFCNRVSAKIVCPAGKDDHADEPRIPRMVGIRLPPRIEYEAAERQPRSAPAPMIAAQQEKSGEDDGQEE